MDITIISEKIIRRGKIITLKVDEREVTLLLTNHLLDAAEEYDVGMERVLSALLFPDEVVRGHSGRFVTHKLLNDYLIRVVYGYENDVPVVITLYIARKGRYFRGGVYEDKILSRFGYT